jgi:hypothetical protein
MLTPDARERIRKGAVNSVIARAKNVRNKYEISPKYCRTCGAKIEFEKRRNDYCNHSCASISTNIGIRRNISKKPPKIPKYKIFSYEKRVERWKNGLDTGCSKNGYICKFLRRYILEKYGVKCSNCGWHKINPHTNTTPLNVHHKDGNSFNNDEENLDLLCPNCHSLTNTFGSLNNGNGRPNRGSEK